MRRRCRKCLNRRLTLINTVKKLDHVFLRGIEFRSGNTSKCVRRCAHLTIIECPLYRQHRSTARDFVAAKHPAATSQSISIIEKLAYSAATDFTRPFNASQIMSTTDSTCSGSSPSPITRINGSVPEGRITKRPPLPRRFSPSAMARATIS